MHTINKANSSLTIFCFISKYLLLIDTINGFCLEYNINLPIGQIYKLILLAFLASQLIKSVKGQWIVAITLIYLLLYINHLNINIHSNIVGESITHFSKFIIVPWIYFYLIEEKKKYDQHLFFQKIVNILQFNILIFCLNIYSGLLGIGTHSYENNIGHKGFFYAVNETSGVGAVLFSFYIFYNNIRYNAHRQKIYISYIILILASLLLGTKTLVIFTLIGVYYIPTTIKSSKRLTVQKKIYKYCILIISCFCLILWGYYILDKIGFVDRWLYFYDKGGIEQIIFSSRNLFWQEEKHDFLSSNFIVQLFGLGGNRTVEMDQFDILLNYGYIGLLIIYSFYIKLIIQVYKYKNKFIISKVILFINALLLCASCLSGHIIFSGMLGPFIGIINSLSDIKNYCIIKYYSK